MKSLEVLGRYAVVGPFAAPKDCSLGLLAHQSLVVQCSAVDASFPLQCAHSDFMHIGRSVPSIILWESWKIDIPAASDREIEER